MDLLFLGNLGTGEIVIIAIVILLLFGGKSLGNFLIFYLSGTEKLLFRYVALYINTVYLFHIFFFSFV